MITRIVRRKLPLSAEGADGAHNGSSGGKRGHKTGGDGKNSLNYWKNLFGSRNELFLNEILLMGSVGTEIHFLVSLVCCGIKGGL